MRPASLAVVALCGAIFGFGLSWSTMVRPEVVLSFLQFADLGLLLVLGGAVTVTLMAYQLAPRLMSRPWLEPAFARHASHPGGRTLLGAAIFGIGWGICGVCPGPAIAGLGSGNWPLLIALAGMFAGAYAQGRWFPGD